MRREKDRRYWRNTNHFTQADTYIEYRFEYMCCFLSDGGKIVNEWRANKKKYTEFTKQTLIDFQHYSRHDASHSVAILEVIEMLLGKDRVDLLNASDLWILLEIAYYHDIGMALTYKELICLWEEDEKFKSFVKAALEEKSGDKKEAALYYRQIDNLINQQEQMNGLDYEKKIDFRRSWPIKLNRYIMVIIAEYIRQNHAKRAGDFAEKRKVQYHEYRHYGEPVIESRLYRLVDIISELHGREFTDIQERLKYAPKGFGSDSLHPQFAAAMLRIGDLLDLDNNRFSMRSIEHFGIMPKESMLHLEKHGAITHLGINESEIQLEARSDDWNVCGKVSEWFQAIEDEVEQLICYWNEIVPEELIGCKLKKCRSQIFYKDTPFEAKNQKMFEVDKEKLIDLMVGENIYHSKLDFLREYIQNAMDATKMRFWLDFKNNDIREEYLNPMKKRDDLSIFDVSPNVFNNYPIEINVSIDWHYKDETETEEICQMANKNKICNPKVILEIIDHGIGMDQECIRTLSTVGKGWRGRKKYSADIRYLRDHLRWLFPTGGFGIGVQSAFMITDQVIIETREIDESFGYKIILKSPELGGYITEQKTKIRDCGTKVTIAIDIDKVLNHELFQELQSYKNNLDKMRQNNNSEMLFDLNFNYISSYELGDIFDKKVISENICCLMEYYIKSRITNPFFPIYIRNKCEEEEKIVRYYSRFLLQEDVWKKLYNRQNQSNGSSKEIYRIHKIKVDEVIYEYNYSGDYCLIWNSRDAILAAVMLWKNSTSSQTEQDMKEIKNIICFRNVRIDMENKKSNAQYRNPLEDSYLSQISLCIDFLGFSAEKVIKIHRDSLREDFDVKKYYRNFLKVFCYIVLQEKNYSYIEKKIDIFSIFLLASNWIDADIILDSISSLTKNAGINKPFGVLRVLQFRKDNEKWKLKECTKSGTEILTILLNEKKNSQIIMVLDPTENKENKPTMDLELLDSGLYEKKLESNIIHYIENNYNEADDNEQKDDQDEINGGICLINPNHVEILTKFRNSDDSLYSCKIGKITDSGSNEDKYIQIIQYNSTEKEKNLKGEKIVDSLEKFLKEMYDGVNIARKIESEELLENYKSIIVSELPFNKEKDKRYLISPIAKKAKREISSEYGLGIGVSVGEKNRKKTIGLKRFKSIIMEEQSEFEFLITWVTKHQSNKPEKTREQIKKEYEKLIEDIYEVLRKNMDDLETPTND